MTTFNPYEEYRLRWMIDHKKGIGEFIESLSGYAEDGDGAANISELFENWERDCGFASEIWACEDEARDCGELVRPDERTEIAKALYSRFRRSLEEDGGYLLRFIDEIARSRHEEAREVPQGIVDTAARNLAEWFADDVLNLFAPSGLSDLVECAAFDNVSDI